MLFDTDIMTGSRENERQHLYFEGDVYRYVVNEKLEHWVEFGPLMKEYPRDFDWFEGERLLLRRLVNRRQRLMSSFVDNTFITNKNLYSIKLKRNSVSIKFVLALLNSKLLSYLYLSQVTQATKDDFPQVTIQDLKSLPVPEADVARHDALVALAERMLGLQAALADSEARSDDRRHALRRRIERLDEEIDAQVHALFGLNDEEIALVEGRADADRDRRA